MNQPDKITQEKSYMEMAIDIAIRIILPQPPGRMHFPARIPKSKALRLFHNWTFGLAW